MASARDFAIVSALVVALILWLRPVVGRLGDPDIPDARGGAATLPVDISKGGSLTTLSPASRPEMSGPVTSLEDVERRVLDATNAERAKQRLQPLVLEEVLRQTARDHSADMLERGFFDHVNPEGASSNDRIAGSHRRLVGLTGENIWRGSGYEGTASEELARTIVDGWMSSPGHRANILKPEYTHLGVGIVSSGGEVLATQNFAMVRALATQPVPMTAARGAELELSPVSGAKGDARRFDLWSTRRGLKVAGPFDLPSARIDVVPGAYQLRFYFLDGPGKYTVVYGPRIEVE